MAAIFLLVVLSALGIFIITIGEAQRFTSLAAMQGTRAYYAAASGLEWGVYQSVVSSSCAATSTFVPAGIGLSGYSVTVTCTEPAGSPYTEAGNSNIHVYIINSTATFGTYGDRDYYSRTLQVTVTNAP